MDSTKAVSVTQEKPNMSTQSVSKSPGAGSSFRRSLRSRKLFKNVFVSHSGKVKRDAVALDVQYLFSAPLLTYPSEESVFVSSLPGSNVNAQEKHGGWSEQEAQ